MGRAGCAASLLVLFAILVISGCNYEDPFAEYRGVNLLADRGLTAASFTPTTATGDNPATYLNYDSTLAANEYGATTGLRDGAESSIHRLENLNLMADGDFELTGDGALPAGWTERGSAMLRGTSGTAGDIAGQSVGFATGPGATDDYIIYDLTGLADGFVSNATYFFQVDFIRESGTTDVAFDYGNGSDASNESYLSPPGTAWLSEGSGGTPVVETMPTPGVAGLDVVNTFWSSSRPSDLFYVGTAVTNRICSGVLDNLRVGRVDTEAAVSLELGDAAEDQLPLPVGTYTFSVYVKSEIDDQVTPSANGLNRYRGNQICLGVNGHQTVISRAEGGWDDATWTRVSRLVELSEEEVAEGSVITLEISVSHQGQNAVGSVLIADPWFELGDTR